MSDRPIIEVENLGKRYRLGVTRGGSGGGGASYQTLRESLSQGARRLLPRGRRADGAALSSTPDETEFWALRDVSFSVRPGEVVGIIGRNGAGKSTLLKILSRITEPTQGRVTLRGRVASLLEVGTGFHPELTGRENIFLNGAVLGMHRKEIRAKFDEIVAFAEVERFLDTPVKRYSSGMYVRLAFAVAAHLEPEILIVDEVLAVGDAEFQKKCLGKMKDVSAGGGRTVLLVSHNMGQLLSICERVVWLQQGCVQADGDSNRLVSQYLSAGADRSSTHNFTDIRKDMPFRFSHVVLKDNTGKVISNLSVCEPFTIEISYIATEAIQGLEVSLRVSNKSGVAVFSSNRARYQGERLSVGKHCSAIDIPQEFLMPNDYRVSLSAFRMGGEVFCIHEDCLSFSIQETGSHMARYTSDPARVGTVLVHFPWTQVA